MALRSLGQLSPSPLQASLANWSRNTRHVRGAIAVAFSGGADSTALLIEQARMRLALQHGIGIGVRAASDPVDPTGHAPLLAFHVHHGLQPAADGFVDHCDAFCRVLDAQWPTALHVTRVDVQIPRGASVEARAREARYDALAGLALEHGAATVLLAQHADDQIETVLIALSRGAGVAGMSGMAAGFEHRGVRFARPLLDVAGHDVRDWLLANDVAFLQDPSNDDDRFTRNRLRRHVLPALNQALPALRVTLARSARLAADAHLLLQEMAREDLTRVGSPPSIATLQALGDARMANVLRQWLRSMHQTTGSEAQLLALVSVVRACTTRGHGIDLRVGRGAVGRVDGRLSFVPFL